MTASIQEDPFGIADSTKKYRIASTARGMNNGNSPMLIERKCFFGGKFSFLESEYSFVFTGIRFYRADNYNVYRQKHA